MKSYLLEKLMMLTDGKALLAQWLILRWTLGRIFPYWSVSKFRVTDLSTSEDHDHSIEYNITGKKFNLQKNVRCYVYYLHLKYNYEYENTFLLSTYPFFQTKEVIHTT